MSFEDTLRAIVREELREFIAELKPGTSTAKSLTRRQAEKAMNVGRSKLQGLIASGAIKTVKDNPRLIPVSEVDRYTQPRRQKPRRRAAPTPPPNGTQNPEALREALRRGGR